MKRFPDKKRVDSRHSHNLLDLLRIAFLRFPKLQGLKVHQCPNASVAREDSRLIIRMNRKGSSKAEYRLVLELASQK